jgi:hypothetical protein
LKSKPSAEFSVSEHPTPFHYERSTRLTETLQGIGQVKETAMLKLCVKNTIDTAIAALQGSKQENIDAALDDSKRKEILDTSELLSLFGRVVEDEDGRPFIFAHDGRGDDDELDDDGSLSRSTPPFARGRESEDEGDDGIVDDA